jgi:hypothetical protein
LRTFALPIAIGDGNKFKLRAVIQLFTPHFASRHLLSQQAGGEKRRKFFTAALEMSESFPYLCSPLQPEAAGGQKQRSKR